MVRLVLFRFFDQEVRKAWRDYAFVYKNCNRDFRKFLRFYWLFAGWQADSMPVGRHLAGITEYMLRMIVHN